MEYQKEKEQKILEEEKKLSPVFNLVNNLKNKEENKEEIATTPAEITNTEENKKEEVLKSQEVKQETKEELVANGNTLNGETQKEGVGFWKVNADENQTPPIYVPNPNPTE